MQRQQFQRGRWQQPLTATLLALMMMVTLFALRGITPFGNHNLLIGDLGVQYTPFFTDFVRLVRQHTWSFMNLHQALGGNWMPVISYYILSPFNLLLFVGRASQIPVMIAVIIMLKVATIAGTMTFYLQEHWRTTSRFVLVFGLAFAFSGFVALNFFNVMWLDALIWLPLVTWGVDQLVRTGRTVAYFGWLFVSVVTDYYLGYMTCLFIVAYFGYVITAEWPKGQSVRAWWHQQRGLIWRFIVTSLLSVGTTLAILLPTVLSMLKTPKASAGLSNFFLVPTFGLEFFSQLGMGTTTYLQRLNHAPGIFVSTFVALLVLIYFALPQVKRGAKVRSASLLLVVFLGMWLRGFNTVWHMLSAPAGYPFRNSFFFSFVLILLAADAWHAGVQQLSRRWRWGLPTILGGLMILGTVMIGPMTSWTQSAYYTSLQPVNWGNLTLSVLILVLAAGVLWYRPQWTGLLGVLVGLELLGNFNVALTGADFGNQRQYAAAYTQAVKRLRPQTTAATVYRIRNNVPTVAAGFAGHYNPYNDSMWLGYNGTGAYSSTISAATIQMSQQLGIFTRNVRRLSPQGFTPVTELIWGVKEKLTTTGTQRVGSYVGMGMAVSPQLLRVHLSADAITNQEAILQALRPQTTPYFRTVTSGHDAVYTKWQINGADTTFPYNHRWWITPTATGRLYFYDPSGTSKYSTMRVNGHLVKPKWFADHQTMMVNLGQYRRGQRLQLTFASQQATVTGMHVATLPAEKMTAVRHQVAQHALTLHQYRGHLRTSYVGNLTGTAQKRWALLSLPAEDGWQITVNDQRVTPRTALHGLITVPIHSGDNHVVIHYHVAGGRLGVLLGLLSLGGYVVLEWRRRN
ncbi:YfhO family protein [Levilactobacillus brevis]